MMVELWERTHLWRNDSRVPAQAFRPISSELQQESKAVTA